VSPSDSLLPRPSRSSSTDPVLVAGYPIPESDLLDLAMMLRRGDYADTADTLEGAVAARLPDVALSIPDRLAILLVLENAHDGALNQLRAVLLQEHVGRVRDGLV